MSHLLAAQILPYSIAELLPDTAPKTRLNFRCVSFSHLLKSNELELIRSNYHASF